MTHQCGSKGNTELHNRNVSYRNNVCEYCVYSVEIFYGESELDNRSNDGCTVENNILRLGVDYVADEALPKALFETGTEHDGVFVIVEEQELNA